MNYYDRRDAAVKIARELVALGWKLYGYSEDRSDSMTDLYLPARWDGIATKGQHVAAVDVRESLVRSYSGRPITVSIPVVAGTCPRCSGAKVDPLGWTLEGARKQPREFNSDVLRARYLGATERGPEIQKLELPDGSSVSHFPMNVVSPIPFDDGRLHCVKCLGTGTESGTPETREVDVYPVFQANPRGRTWHVEAHGTIVLSGVGLQRCLLDQHARALAQRLDAVTGTTVVEQQLGGGVTLTPNPEKGGLELRFTSKPSAEILASLKAQSWRWSRFARCWYTKNTPANKAFAQSFLQRA